MKLTLQNEKRLAMLTELLKLCKYFVLYYPFPNIIIIIQHNNWQISIFGLYFFCYPVLSGGVLLALWEKIFTDKFGRITSPWDTWPPPVYAFYAKQWLDIHSKLYFGAIYESTSKTKIKRMYILIVYFLNKVRNSHWRYQSP